MLKHILFEKMWNKLNNVLASTHDAPIDDSVRKELYAFGRCFDIVGDMLYQLQKHQEYHIVFCSIEFYSCNIHQPSLKTIAHEFIDICCLDDISVTHNPQFGLVWVETRVVGCKTWWMFYASMLFICSKVFGNKQKANKLKSISVTTVQLPLVFPHKLFYLLPPKDFTKCLNNYLTAPN